MLSPLRLLALAVVAMLIGSATTSPVLEERQQRVNFDTQTSFVSIASGPWPGPRTYTCGNPQPRPPFVLVPSGDFPCGARITIFDQPNGFGNAIPATIVGQCNGCGNTIFVDPATYEALGKPARQTRAWSIQRGGW